MSKSSNASKTDKKSNDGDDDDSYAVKLKKSTTSETDVFKSLGIKGTSISKLDIKRLLNYSLDTLINKYKSTNKIQVLNNGKVLMESDGEIYSFKSMDELKYKLSQQSDVKVYMKEMTKNLKSKFLNQLKKQTLIDRNNSNVSRISALNTQNDAAKVTREKLVQNILDRNSDLIKARKELFKVESSVARDVSQIIQNQYVNYSANRDAKIDLDAQQLSAQSSIQSGNIDIANLYNQQKNSLIQIKQRKDEMIEFERQHQENIEQRNKQHQENIEQRNKQHQDDIELANQQREAMINGFDNLQENFNNNNKLITAAIKQNSADTLKLGETLGNGLKTIGDKLGVGLANLSSKFDALNNNLATLENTIDNLKPPTIELIEKILRERRCSANLIFIWGDFCFQSLYSDVDIFGVRPSESGGWRCTGQTHSITPYSMNKLLKTEGSGFQIDFSNQTQMSKLGLGLALRSSYFYP